MFRWFSRKPKPVEEECEYVILESEEPEAKYYTPQELYEQNNTETVIDIEPIEDSTEVIENEVVEEIKEIKSITDVKHMKNETVFLPQTTDVMENTLRAMLEYILNFDIVVERCIINWCNF